MDIVPPPGRFPPSMSLVLVGIANDAVAGSVAHQTGIDAGVDHSLLLRGVEAGAGLLEQAGAPCFAGGSLID